MVAGCEGRQSRPKYPHWWAWDVAQPKDILAMYAGDPQGIETFLRVGRSTNRATRAYLAGYDQLTSFNRRQWFRLFPAWTATERWNNWSWSQTLVVSGCSWVSGPSSGLSVVLGLRSFCMSCPCRCGMNLGVAKRDIKVFQKKKLNPRNKMQKLKRWLIWLTHYQYFHMRYSRNYAKQIG